MKYLRIIHILFVLICNVMSTSVNGQQRDSITFDQFRELVFQNHPLIRQAQLNPMKGESAVQMARGAFDPKIGGQLNNKFFNNQEYYNLQMIDLKMATPSPISIKTGFEKNSGNYYNPESNTPDNGLWLAGVSVPLLQGLITDERRTALRVAKAFNEYSTIEQKAAINDLLLKAYHQYWLWWNASEKSVIADSVLSISAQQLSVVRSRALAGDLPLIDTLETYVQFQNRLQISQEFKAQELKERLLLSSYLWTSDANELVALAIPENIKPSYLMSSQLTINDDKTFASLSADLTNSNPQLNQYQWKFETLDAEERWKKEKLKPTLNVNYNFLTQSLSQSDDAGFSTQNYKWGLDMSFPIFLRKERGDLEMTRIKIRETQYEFQQKTRDIENYAGAIFGALKLTRQQLEVATGNQFNYLTLLNAEKEKFFSGESSVFVVNQRQQQYAEARNKVIDLQSKIMMLQFDLQHKLGVIR